MNETVERGSSALRAAVDTMVRVSRTRNRLLVLECDKQKDADCFEAMRFRLNPVTLGPDSLDTSCILVPADSLRDEHIALGKDEQQMISALRDLPGSCASTATWHRAAAAHSGKPIKERTFYRRIQHLKELALIEAAEKKGRYRATDAATAIGMPLAPPCDPHPVATATTR